jgi:3,4-dehydroadipyl-CoA semialdehyde dehydrogenase
MPDVETLASYLHGSWQTGQEPFAILENPTTEQPIAQASTHGLDMAGALRYARDVGGPALRAMTFAQRGEMLAQLSKAIHEAREELIEAGIANAGNTRGDAKFDIDGASGTLMSYAELGKELGDHRWLLDGDAIHLGRSSRYAGQHVFTTRHGVAIHINAFNFPAWGLAEKAAVALLAGVPVIAKPATATALMTVRLVERLVKTSALPAGALSLIVGSTGDLLEQLEHQDMVAFTGSNQTGTKLRGLPNILRQSVRFNVEADSLNTAILGADVDTSSETYDLFLTDVARDVTQKTGQKCTAIRRVFVPEAMLEQVSEDLTERLQSVVIGDPSSSQVRMGPVATKSQLHEVRSGIKTLTDGGHARVILGGTERPQLEGIDNDRGYFVAPTLLVAKDPDLAEAVHSHEVFGPVVTLMPYKADNVTKLVTWVGLGGGGLVASLYSDDRGFARTMLLELAVYHGRVTLGSAKMAGVSMGPGLVYPNLVHGGPGRAGGGEELGGCRGLQFYMQRTAIQGYGPLIDHIVKDGGTSVR